MKNKHTLYSKDGVTIYLWSIDELGRAPSDYGLAIYRCGNYTFSPGRFMGRGAINMITKFFVSIGHEVKSYKSDSHGTVFELTDEKDRFEFILKHGKFNE